MLVEIGFGGALMPSLLVYAMASLVLFVIIDRVATAAGFYGIVWHPALVRVALWAGLISALVLLTRPEGSQ